MENDATDNDQVEHAPHILTALLRLPLFDELFLRMQATNLSIVDGMIEPMEADLLYELIEIERTPVPTAMAVSAMSQMWMFAAYELLRTWRQRVQSLLKTYDRIRSLPHPKRMAVLRAKASSLRSARGDGNLALEMRQKSILRLADADFGPTLRKAYDLVEPIFRRIETLRVTLAKHEVPKSGG